MSGVDLYGNDLIVDVCLDSAKSSWFKTVELTGDGLFADGLSGEVHPGPVLKGFEAPPTTKAVKVQIVNVFSAGVQGCRGLINAPQQGVHSHQRATV